MSITQKNLLLDALSVKTYRRLVPHLELVTLEAGEVLYEPGQEVEHIYFPVDSIVSFMMVLGSGVSAGISMVGNEGLVGIASFMGGGANSTWAAVQNTGSAYRMAGQKIKDEFKRDNELLELMLRYTHLLLLQMAQTAACNRRHSIEQQLCRFLLSSLDRLPSMELNIKQDEIAKLLGVRREGVSEASSKLQVLGAVRYSRGRIIVLNRSILERLSCVCYSVVKTESDRLLRRGSTKSAVPITG